MINNVESKRTRGRPRSFDKDTAIQKAAHVFWERGYEGTSIEELTAAMSITTQSLYAAFGSKAALYKSALAWYDQEIAVSARRWLRKEPNVSKAVLTTFRHLAKQFTRKDRPRGCMRSSAMIRCATEHEELAAHVASLRAETVQSLKDRLDIAVQDHQLASRTDTATLAGFLNSLIVGMSVAARDGATEKTLLSFARLACECIDARRQAVNKQVSARKN